MFYWLCGMEDEYSSVNNLDNNLPIFPIEVGKLATEKRHIVNNIVKMLFWKGLLNRNITVEGDYYVGFTIESRRSIRTRLLRY